MFGGEAEGHVEEPGEEFARGHYEQLVAGKGSVKIGTGDGTSAGTGEGADETWAVDGFGLRDHSWGPRTWQAPWYYRWLTANAGRDFGFMASRVARREGEGRRGGFVWDESGMYIVPFVEISTEWQGDDSYHRTVSVRMSDGQREWKATGRVLSLIPLRNRREGLVTRISEGLTEWTMDDGRVAYGLSEYLDQIIDGLPVGIAE
jgi:hypothetical protein